MAGVVTAAAQSQSAGSQTNGSRTNGSPSVGSQPSGSQSAGSAPAATEPAGTEPVAGFEIAALGSAKVVGATAVEQPPALDGDVLGDAVWAAATPVTGFRQTAPDEGRPATERTEVRILFTDDTIYFGIVCYDRDPSAIIMSDSRRDSSMTDADSFQLVLDTFSDRQNGFVFGTTPAGQEYDGQVINEGGRAAAPAVPAAAASPGAARAAST